MDKIQDALKAVVQPALALMFGGTACYAFLIERMDVNQWMTLAGVIIGSYFASKIAETSTANAQRRAPNRATDITNVEGNVNVSGNELPPNSRPEGTRRRR